MKLGNYRIGQYISEIKNELTEVSSSEYRILGRSFKDERIFHGRDIEYLGTKWRVVIGVADDRVYKVALQTDYVSEIFGEKDDNLWEKVFKNLMADYGAFTEQHRKGQSFFTIWDREWGNIILTMTIMGEANFDLKNVGKNVGVLDLSFTGNFPFKKSKFWKKVFQNGN